MSGMKDLPKVPPSRCSVRMYAVQLRTGACPTPATLPRRLHSLPLPPSNYPLWDSLPPELVSSGKLSTLQLEGILYACTKHCEMLPSGERAGFFIGDGAGVGKGRQIAGIIIDNFVRGRKRSLWLSTSSDLHADATRDLRDLGCQLTIINNVAALDRESRALGLAKEYREGVLFMTYSTLISQVKGRSRLQQVIDWLVFGAGTNGGPTAGDGAASALSSWDGLIVLDECHKAKNFVPGKEAASTKVASAVIALQERLPRARVLYCSATGVSEVGNMAYMVRMGLWGRGTAFGDFQTFLDSMRRRGVSFMEMLAMEMKAEGKYVARGLSFREAEFTEVEAPLNEQQIRMYDNAAKVWSRVKTQVEAALAATGGGRDVWKAFWSTQQRFFKLLCVSLKVPAVVSEAREALAAGQCVVIGLQTTGEAAADAVGLEPGPVPGFVSPTKEMLLRFVAQHFPVRRTAAADSAAAAAAAAAAGGGGAYGLAAPYSPWGYEEPVPPPGVEVDGGTGGEGEEIPACVSMREELLAAIDSLQLPANFLDEIIDYLGGPGKVAEMTGRKGRVVRVASSGSQPGSRPRLVYELRAKPDSCEMDSLNIAEKDAFLRGSKLVAIISDAASTGISLHASRTAANQRRRRHLTIELPWSADKAIQQLGRSHRSNQVSAPLYKLISTRIGGEKRFAAAVARRLQSLGALTRGDRRAASGVDLSDSNFDSPIGRKSLRRMYDHIMLPTPVLPQGVTLADVFREHPALARARGAGIIYGDGATEARSLAPPGPGESSGSRSVALFDFDDPAVVALHVAALHESCRRSCEDMGLDLPAPKPGAVAAAAGGRGDVTAEDAGSKDADDGRGSGGDVRRFLNRLLGLRVEAQGLLFAYYAAVLGAEIQKARAEGKYSEGLADVAGTRIRLQSRNVMWVDPLSRLVTTNTAFSVDRGLSWEAAKRRLERERLPGDSSGFRMSRRPLGSSYLVLLALQKPGARNLFSIARPNTGAAYFDMDRSDLEAKYLPPPAPGSSAEAQLEGLWRTAYEAALKQCSHGPGCRLGPDCGVGRRITTVNVLSGSVVRVWGVLEAVLSRREMELPKMERTLRVVRVEWGDNEGDGGGGSGGEDGSAQPMREDDNAADMTEGPQPSGSPQVILSCSTDGDDGGGADDTASAPIVDSAGGTSDTAADDTNQGSGGGAAAAAAGFGRCRRNSADADGCATGSSPSSQQHVVGVRYPGALLQEVVLALTATSIQNALAQMQAAGPLSQRTQHAAAAVALIPPDNPTQVDSRVLAQAFRPPRTLLHFFRKPDQGQVGIQGGIGEVSPGTEAHIPADSSADMASAAAAAAGAAAGLLISSTLPVAVAKRERELFVGDAGAVKTEGLAPPSQQQLLKRLPAQGDLGVDASGREVAAPLSSAQPAKRPRFAATPASGRGGGSKHQQQQHALGGGSGGGIMAAFARGHQVQARQQQQRRVAGTQGPASAAAVADDDVIDVVSVDCSERTLCGGTASVERPKPAALSCDVVMLASSDDDNGDGAAGGDTSANAAGRRSGGSVAAKDGDGSDGGDGGEGVTGTVGAKEVGKDVRGFNGTGCDDEYDVDVEVEEDDSADEDLIIEDDGGKEDWDDWQPAKQRDNGAAAGYGSCGHARGRSSHGRSGYVTAKRGSLGTRQAATSRGGVGGKPAAYGGNGGGDGESAAAATTVAKLQGMGFSARQAEKASWMARGDFARAVELCLQGM
ncbi:hypothetical protein Vafri_15702 [Volvox africanus]|uniref:UBA domain-containing protein n=1 Tax=Volvox africanus TaxID=51714 RepID=A0A8J4F877_9CHLO|nr:hypothetical protein Vafri_15702 [Volvox africanus]